MTSRSVSELPTPQLEPSVDAQPYWDAADRGQLVLPRCRRCSYVIWYPRSFCPSCSSTDVDWFEASGRGSVYSYTIVRRSQGDYADAVPYVLAYVELDEGPRVLTNVVGAVDAVEIGVRVEAIFDPAPGGAILRFRPTQS